MKLEEENMNFSGIEEQNFLISMQIEENKFSVVKNRTYTRLEMVCWGIRSIDRISKAEFIGGLLFR